MLIQNFKIVAYRKIQMYSSLYLKCVRFHIDTDFLNNMNRKHHTLLLEALFIHPYCINTVTDTQAYSEDVTKEW